MTQVFGPPQGRPPDGEARGVAGVPPPLVDEEREAVVGAIATAARLALLPLRVAARAPVLGAALAAAGRDARAEVTREVDHVLAGPVPEAVERALADGQLDTQVAAALRRALVSPAVREVLRDETRGAGDRTLAALRSAAVRADARLDRRHGAGRDRYGGVATRGIALVLDLALAQVALASAGGILALLTSIAGELRPAWLVGLAVGIAWGALVVAYFVGFWTLTGQTLGMQLVGVRVVGPGGRTPGAARSLLRLAGLVLAIVPCLAGFLPALWDARRRALPDYLAGTVVVRC